MQGLQPLLSRLKSNKYIILFFVLLLMFLAYITLYSSGGIGDEGLILADVQKMAHGQLIYRDFFSWITPGLYYLLLWVWNIFGQQYIVVRILTMLIAWLIGIFIYLTSRAILNKSWSLINVVIFVTLFYPRHMTYSYHWVSLLLTLIAVCLVNIYLKNPKIKFLISGGIVLGLGLYFLHTRVMVALVSVALFLYYYDRQRLGSKNASRNCFVFLASAGFLFLCLMLPHLLKVGWPTLWFDLVTSNLFYYPTINYLPLKHNLAFILTGGVHIFLFFLLFRKKLFTPQISLYYFYSLCLFISVCYRFDTHHLAYIYSSFALPLSLYVLSQIKISLKKIPEFLSSSLLLAPLLFYHESLIGYYLDHRQWQAVPTKIGLVYLTKSHAPMAQSVLRELEQIPDKNVLLYPSVAYYYPFSDKVNPTKYNIIYGKYLDDKTKAEIMNDLANKNIRYIIYLPTESRWEEPDEKFLTQFLTMNYAEKKIQYQNYDGYFYLYTKK
ncbi:MAG: hypothetical protein WC465_04350 [Patescibacteria group bacterium]